MADVIHCTTLEFRSSVNEPDFPEPTWKWNPSLAAVVGVPQKYWKAPASWSPAGAGPVEMNQTEKDAVDAAEAAAVLAALENQQTLNNPALEKGDMAVHDGSKIRRLPVGADDEVLVADSTDVRGVKWKRRLVPVVKSANQTRNNTNTLAADSELTFPVVADGLYVFRLRVFYDTTAAADFKFDVSGPAAPTAVRIRRCAIAPNATAFSAIGLSTAFAGAGFSVTGTVSGSGYVDIEGAFLNGANAGNVAFQWAQNTSDAGNTTVLRGSSLEYARVG